MSLYEAWRLFGCSRQAYYQQKERTFKQQALELKVVEVVQQIRMRMPGLGTRMLYHLLREQLRGLKVGRGRLFAILGSEGLLVRPKRSCHRNHRLQALDEKAQEPGGGPTGRQA